MISTESNLSQWLSYQRTEYGGRWEVQTGFWAVFAVPANDPKQQKIALELLADAPFPVQEGESEDSAWRLHFVDSAHRVEAMQWIDGLHAEFAGEIKSPTQAQRALIRSLTSDAMPHRIAQQLSSQHEAGSLTAGAIKESDLVRTLLDRLHEREPLYFSALLKLIEVHLVDLVSLHRRLIAEDIELLNSLTQGSVSQDPFFNNRQYSAGAIRKQLVEFGLINALDQQRDNTVKNPYAVMTDTRWEGDYVTLRFEGMAKQVATEDLRVGIRGMRKLIYGGEDPLQAESRTPWSSESTVSPTRFLKQHIRLNPEISALDWLYIFERAIDPAANA